LLQVVDEQIEGKSFDFFFIFFFSIRLGHEKKKERKTLQPN